MLLTDRDRRAFAWLAFAAMLAMAVMPTIVHALSRGTDNYADVCTLSGIKRVTLAAGQAAPAPPSSGSSDTAHVTHCPFCNSAAGALLLPAAPRVLGVLPLVGPAPPTLFMQAPRTLFAWRSAQPRGPPTGS